MKKKFDLKTFEGSRRLFGISVALVVLFCFIGYMLACDFGKVKVSELSIDSRGSVMQATMYTPRNVSAEDSIPCVIITHGLSCNHSAVNGIAEELGRRGFAVLSVSTYGSGASETSDLSDPSYGLYDALQYVRTLNYVDQTRVGMIGHSQGSKNTSAVVDMDSSLLTLNDLKINILYNTFGKSFTEDEIKQDADSYAKANLTPTELAAYDELAQQAETYFNTRLKSAIILGGNWGSEQQTVSVAGHDVLREVNTNILYEIATFNEGRAGTGQQNLANPDMLLKFQTTEPIVASQWYALDQTSNAAVPASTEVGDLYKVSYVADTSLQTAIDSRTTRMMVNQVNGHARDYFSTDAARYVVKYFEQTLQYSNGALTAETASVQHNDINIRFIAREWCDLFALLSLCVSMIALAGMALQTATFSKLRMETCKPFASRKTKLFWAAAAALVLISMFAEYIVAKKGPMLGFKSEWIKHLLSLDFTANIHLVFMWIIAGLSLIVLVVFALLTKKSQGRNMIKELNVTISFKKILGYFGLATSLIVYGYLMTSIMKYFFHQDMRFWDTGVKDMLPQNWMLCLRYGIIILPTFVIASILVNAGRMTDMKEGTNTLLQMGIASVGIYAMALWSYGSCYLTYSSTGVGNAPAIAFISTWAMLINLPLFAFISRKMYQISGSIWLGSFVNTWLVCWMMCSGQSSTSYYLLTNFATKWLGIF